MKEILMLMALSFSLSSFTLTAQGPAIISDSPIMLGGETKILRSLVESRKTSQGTFIAFPLNFQYITSSKTSLTLQVPFVNSRFDGSDPSDNAFGLGDISLEGKYQFYRKDGKGKTFRALAKTRQILPTGEDFSFEQFSVGDYQSYFALFAGYEALHLGITNEIGYQFSPSGSTDELRYRLGFGLPLLKPSYPVNQLNLYFEYQSSWYPEFDEYMLLYAQGIQYARGRYAIEAAVQVPLVQNRNFIRQRDYSIFFGGRVILN